MSKGKSTWKYNKLLTARRNYYAEGGPNIFQKAYGAASNWVSNNLNTTANVAQAAGQTIGGAIGGGLQSGAGNVIGGLSNIASAIPGPYGKLASAALSVVGGITNAAFGSKINEENVAEVEANIDQLNNFKSDASDYDTLSANYASAPTEMEFTDKFIGKDGWFSNKAEGLANDLRTQQSTAANRVQRTLANNAQNIAQNQADTLEANYASEGGKIEIDPKNKGKFNATKKRTGKTTEELTHSKNPLTRKRAIFAQNAAKWHHAYGGNLFTNGGVFSNGLTYINEGDSHEMNPNTGVQIGVDNEGIPNLVEEGETIFNDFVFSKRINVPKAVRNKYKLRGEKSLSFADASKKLAKESEERPNDPISQRGLEAAMMNLAQEQELIKAKRQAKQMPNIAAYGGNLFYNGGKPSYQRTFDLTYQPKEFIPQEEVVRPPLLIDDSYYHLGELPELVVTGKKPKPVTDQDIVYAFQDPITRMRNEIAGLNDKPNPVVVQQASIQQDSYAGEEHPESIVAPENQKKKANTSQVTNNTRKPVRSRKQQSAQIPTVSTEDLMDYALDNNQSPTIVPRSTPVEGLFSTDELYDTSMDVLTPMSADETLRAAGLNDTSTQNNGQKKKSQGTQTKPRDTSLMYAPIVAQAGSVLTDALGLTNKADYSNAARVAAAARGLSDYTPVKYTPSGTYLTYRPFDRDYYLNKYNAANAATRRNIMNTSGGNRATAMTGLLAADTNYLNQIGELGVKAEQYNRGQEQQVASFNRATDEMNAKGFLQAATANQQARANANKLAYEGLATAAQMREAERLGTDAARAANISGLATSLGDLGKFNANLNARDFMMSYMNMTPEQRAAFGYSKGGKINRKKKKGLTI